MSHRIFKIGLVACLAGAGLAAVESQVNPASDLDDYTDEQLQRDLEDELDDIYDQLGDPDGEHGLDVLRADILAALGDGGDEGYEAEINLTDLNEEMSEAETSLEDVVDEALARADELALRGGSPGWTIALAGASGHRSAQKRDKATTATVAVRETERAIIFNVRRAKS